MKPSFIIIGGVKCASSSLYRYLNEHPQVLPCKTKEPQFFNSRNPLKLLKGYRNYLDLFPKKSQNEVIADWLEIGDDLKMEKSQFTKEISDDINYITGEATASLFVTANPRLIKLFFPKIKIILLLRDPAERYISHFKMFKRLENEGFENFKGMGEIEDFVHKEITDLNNGKPTKILHQGLYINYLPKWNKVFKNNLKIIYTKDLNNANTSQKLNEITDYLGLEKYDFSYASSKKHNVSPTDERNEKIERKLDNFYAPFNAKLSKEFNLVF